MCLESKQDYGDELARLVCADGTILIIEQGGKAICKVLSNEETMGGVSVWVIKSN